MTTEYLTVADTAKLVRKALKKEYPNFKGFSVRSKSYAGGASIDVDWTDGPIKSAVDNVIKKYEGATFDGMQDLKEYKSSELDGKPVHFGSDFVFSNRHNTDAHIQKCINKLAEKYPGNFKDFANQITVENYNKGKLWGIPFFGPNSDKSMR